MDEYKARDKEVEFLIEKRKRQTNQQGIWDYASEVEKFNTQQPFKYQNVEEPEMELDSMKDFIFDENIHPQDLRLFKSNEWSLTPMDEKKINPPTVIPSKSYFRTVAEEKQNQIRQFYGQFQLDGMVQGKSNQIHYKNYHFNLRSNLISFYKSNKAQDGERDLFHILLNEKTYDYLSDSSEYTLINGQNKNLKILKNEGSAELLRRLEKKLTYFSFRGAYALRNEVPSWKVEDYLLEEIDTVGPLNFHDEGHLKDIVKSPYYRQTIGAFFTLLERISKKRKNKAGEVTLPQWLKEQFRSIPLMSTWLSTNVTPPHQSLLSLKIKVNNNEKQGMIHALKYVFPYLNAEVKRTIVVYESELVDEEAAKILNYISYPFYAVGFPRNKLSHESLFYAIDKSSDLYNEILDFSFNEKIVSIGGSKILNLLNNNPTLKKLYLKGCYIAEGQQKDFFHSLKSNLTLLQLELDYLEHYNESMVQFLQNFQAIIE